MPCPNICLGDTKLPTVQPIDFYELFDWLYFPSKIFEELRVEIQLFISNKQFDKKGARDHFKVMKMPNYKLERVRTILEYQCISNSISNH